MMLETFSTKERNTDMTRVTRTIEVGWTVVIGTAEYTVVASQVVHDAQFQVKRQEGDGGHIAPRMMGPPKCHAQYVLMIDPTTLDEGDVLENAKPITVSAQELSAMATEVRPPRPEPKLAEAPEPGPSPAEIVSDAAGTTEGVPIRRTIGMGAKPQPQPQPTAAGEPN